MPFLWVSDAKAARVDEAVLASRLCPYSATLAVLDMPLGGRLWHTPIVTSSLEMPAQKSKCSAWGRIERLPGGVRFSTDPLGTLPLWKITRPGFTALAAEAKAFAALDGVTLQLKSFDELTALGERPIDWSPYLNVERLPPGSRWEAGPTWREVTPSPWQELLATRGASTDTAALGDALASALEGDSVQGAFISGGIDSSIAAALIHARHTWSLGTRAGNEFAQAAQLAQHLGSAHHETQLLDEDIVALWNDVIRANEIFDGMTAEIVLQLASLVKAAGAIGITTGYGADLLFGGMLRHEAYLDAVGVRTTRGLIARTLWSGELSPFFAWQHGVTLHPVFWSQQVIRAALSLDPSIHFDGTHEKVPLRRLAVSRGWLTEPLAFRAKVGMTVGTAAYQLVAQQLGLLNEMDYAGRSRLATKRLLLELEKHAAG